MALARWRPVAEIALWRHGWAWAIASVLTLAAAGGYLLLLQPLRQERDAALLELAQAQRSRDAGKALPGPDFALDDGARLHALQALMVAGPDAGQVVRRMVTLARDEQITLAQAEYQQQVNASTGVTRVQISQPVRATYPQLRRYVEAVLASTPNASLDQVVARRDNVGQAQLEARLKWSVWIARPTTVPPASVNRKESMQ